MNINSSSSPILLQTIGKSKRDFDVLEKRLYDIEQKYKQLYCREVFYYNSKIYLKDPNNTIYAISNPSKKLGIYINKIITFCNMDDELSEEYYESV
jgi:hypothetical protein